MTRYSVFWTYLGNYADSPRVVTADNPVDAIEKAFFYDPRAKSQGGHYMKFLVHDLDKGQVVDYSDIFDFEKRC